MSLVHTQLARTHEVHLCHRCLHHGDGFARGRRAPRGGRRRRLKGHWPMPSIEDESARTGKLPTRSPSPEARDQATLSWATLGLPAATMSQMYSQMSQIGDELDGDAAFGEFAAAWDSHTPAVHAAAALAPQEASEVTHAGGGQLGPAKQAQILKISPYSDFNLGCVRTRALTFQSFCHCTRSQSLTKEESSASALFFSKFAAEDSGARCVCVCVCVCVCINIRYIYCICVCICIYLGYLNPKP